MHRLGAWGLSAALAAGAAAPAAAADPAPRPAGDKPWYSRLWGSADPAAGKPADPPIPARPPVAVAPLAPEQVAAALKAEQEAYLRRLEVCTRLRLVASEHADDRLLAQADELERQATALYHNRVARFGVRSPRPAADAPSAVAERPVLKPLDDKLGAGVATDPLAARPASKPASDPPATAMNRTFREVQP